MIGGLYDNMMAKPIKDFKFIEKDEVLESGMQEATSYDFKGMNSFCLCNGEFTASCKKEQDGCELIEGPKAAQLKLWKGKRAVFRRYKKKELSRTH